MNRIVIESHPLLIGADIRALAESPSEALLITSGTLVDELRRDPQVPVSHKFALGGTVSGVLQTMRAIENYDGLHTTDERALFLCREALSNCPIGFGSEDSECDLRSASRPPNARWAIGKLYGLSVAEPAAVAAIVKHSAFESMLLDESGAPTIDAERRLKRIDSCRNLIVTVLSPDCQDAYNNN